MEDISIEHDPVREIGYLALSVAPDARGCAGRDDVVAWLDSLLASGRYAEARV